MPGGWPLCRTHWLPLRPVCTACRELDHADVRLEVDFAGIVAPLRQSGDRRFARTARLGLDEETS